MRRMIPIVCSLAMTAVSVAQSVPDVASQGAVDQSTATTPRVAGVLDGSRTAVFETPRDSCTFDDIPDAMARAFRDYTGTVHFVTASSDLFQSLGPDLDNLQHSCEVAHRSANDPNPAHYNDQTWLDSFYTLDGMNIAALTHTEYHGWAHTGECDSQNFNECEYDSDTYHLSTDGGYTFEAFKAPANFLAGIPYEYVIDDGPAGYSVDTNVIDWGGWYYAVATSWTWPPNCTGQGGANPCLTSGGAPIRTKNVFDPASWRGWSGSDFSVSFVDPYLGPVQNPQEHVYTSVPDMAFVNGIYIYQPSNVVVAVLWDYFDTELGPEGLYFATSTDLVHWTRPLLVATLTQIEANDPPGNWLYAYFSLIDPSAPDLNFSMIGDHPYLYYVRLDLNGQDRVVFRQKVGLSVNP